MTYSNWLAIYFSRQNVDVDFLIFNFPFRVILNITFCRVSLVRNFHLFPTIFRPKDKLTILDIRIHL